MQTDVSQLMQLIGELTVEKTLLLRRVRQLEEANAELSADHKKKDA